MTEERKQELEQLLAEAMANLEVRDSRLKYYPYDTCEVTKSKLLDFIRVEFDPFIHEDFIQPASSFIAQSFLYPGHPLDVFLKQLLKIAVGRGIDEAVSDFDKCTKNTPASFQYIALLEGVKLTTETQLFEGVRLIPLPNSPSEFPKRYFPDVLVPGLGLPANFFCSKTLLVIDASISPIFPKPFPNPFREGFREDDLPFQVEVHGGKVPDLKAYDVHAAVRHALSLACNSSVQISLEWRLLPEDELFNLHGLGVGGVTRRYDANSSSRSFTEAGETQIDKAKCLYDRLVNLNSNVRKKLRIPINRWIKSKAHGNSVDKMIDLGIAFESLYLSDIGETTELSFRLRLHAAWHLGKNKGHRKALMKEFREIYDWRSSVVHTGELPKKKVSKNKRKPYTEEEVVGFLKRAQDLCRQSIMKILEEGRFPNWNDLILGGNAEDDTTVLGENPDDLG